MGRPRRKEYIQDFFDCIPRQPWRNFCAASGGDTTSHLQGMPVETTARQRRTPTESSFGTQQFCRQHKHKDSTKDNEMKASSGATPAFRNVLAHAGGNPSHSGEGQRTWQLVPCSRRTNRGQKPTLSKKHCIYLEACTRLSRPRWSVLLGNIQGHQKTKPNKVKGLSKFKSVKRTHKGHGHRKARDKLGPLRVRGETSRYTRKNALYWEGSNMTEEDKAFCFTLVNSLKMNTTRST